MAENTNIGREFDWDDEIVNDGQSFEPLPAGDYNFTIDHYERGRSSGEGKLPPCNMAIVHFVVHGHDRDVTIKENYLLHSIFERKLSQLFRSVGLKKEGESFRMDFNALPGLEGRCRVKQSPGYKDPEKIYNAIAELYPKEPKKYTAGSF